MGPSSSMKFTDVPIRGWHRPRPGELETLPLDDGHTPDLGRLLERYELFLNGGSDPAWSWVVYQERGKPPVAVAMYRSGQHVELPTKLAKVLIRRAREEAALVRPFDA